MRRVRFYQTEPCNQSRWGIWSKFTRRKEKWYSERRIELTVPSRILPDTGKQDSLLEDDPHWIIWLFRRVLRVWCRLQLPSSRWPGAGRGRYWPGRRGPRTEPDRPTDAPPPSRCSAPTHNRPLHHSRFLLRFYVRTRKEAHRQFLVELDVEEAVRQRRQSGLGAELRAVRVPLDQMANVEVTAHLDTQIAADFTGVLRHGHAHFAHPPVGQQILPHRSTARLSIDILIDWGSLLVHSLVNAIEMIPRDSSLPPFILVSKLGFVWILNRLCLCWIKYQYTRGCYYVAISRQCLVSFNRMGAGDSSPGKFSAGNSIFDEKNTWKKTYKQRGRQRGHATDADQGADATVRRQLDQRHRSGALARADPFAIEAQYWNRFAVAEILKIQNEMELNLSCKVNINWTTAKK